MRCLLPIAALLIMAAASPPARAPAQAPAASTVVQLAPQPGTALDVAARQLTATDLAEATKAGEAPLVLVGTARLSQASGERAALFVQLQSARECGSAGCETSVFLWRKGAWTRVLDGVGGKIALASTRTRGMADLVTDKDRFVWSGSEYRSAAPAPTVDLRRRRR